MYSWIEVLQQWKQGVLYPRWAALAHWGYGEARFLFYPPGSWTLGAALGAILPWKMVPGAYCWIILTLAGVSMYRLALQWFNPSDALFAGALYAVNPYHLLIVYWRSAYAELLAAILVPLTLLGLLRLREAGVRPILWLSLTFAGAWLANAPAAVMIHYLAAALALLLAAREESAGKAMRILQRAALAGLLGAGLASVYLVPAIYEQPWINVGALMSPGVRPQDNFLFTTIADADHNRFNLLLSLVALSEIILLAFAMWQARIVRGHDKNKKDAGLDRGVWTLLGIWGTAAALVMLPISRPLWDYLPKFRFVQLPFRWLLCLNAPLALLLASATNRSRVGSAVRTWSWRGIACGFLLAMLLFAGHRILPPWWDQSADIQEMKDAITDGTGYEGSDEYVPAGADPYEISQDLPLVSDERGAPLSVQMLAWNASDKRFRVRSDSSRELILRLFNYPAWAVRVNGHRVAARSSEGSGLMIIPVGAGESEVEVHFGRTDDRLAGALVSLISAGIFAAAFCGMKRNSQLPSTSKAAA